MRRHGFTLIELLVVIAIIAILAAILFPVFAKAREKARQSSCQSNSKQIVLAVTQYTQDYDEVTPMVSYGYAATPSWPMPDGSLGNAMMWYHVIVPYMKSHQLLNCPSYPGTRYTGFYHPPGGVGCNQFGWGRSLGTYTKPAEFGLIMDMGWNRSVEPDINKAASRSDGYYICDWDIPGADAAGGWDGNAPNPRHNLATNCGFLDGHVKTVSTANLIADNNHTGGWPTSATLRNFWDPTAP